MAVAAAAGAGQPLSAALPVGSAPAAGILIASPEVSGRDTGAVAMEARRREPWFSKDYYKDGWRFGGRNMWMEDQMGGNWMNITTLRTYTFPSGRLKPRVMTKLRLSDHKRAIRYIKRLRIMGLMPFHRIQAKLETDPEARRPPMQQKPGMGGA